MKFSACIILYHPKEADIKNINTYLHKFEKIYIYDNTEQSTLEKKLKHLSSKILYFHDGENKGLAIRLNQACNQAIKDGYDYLLTMDQDSYFSKQNLDQYINDIENFKEPNKVGLFGLDYDYSELIVDATKIEINEVSELITSGSIVNLSNFKTIGGFDENLFIDGVDIDYCFATLKNNLKCIKFKNNFFVHSLGVKIKRGSIKSLYILKKEKVIHSPLRIYYMIRNMLYIEKKYEIVFPELISVMKKNYLAHIKMNINYSTNIFKSLKYKSKAIKDFKNSKMGKFE